MLNKCFYRVQHGLTNHVERYEQGRGEKKLPVQVEFHVHLYLL
jgi:hypothetical protein